MQVLKGLSKACQFKLPNTAQEYEDEYVRDSFISGLSSPSIRQRLLEEKDLTLDQAYQKARSMEIAQLQSQSYQGRSSQINVNAIDHLSNYTSSETSSSGKMSRPVSPELPDGHINAVSKRSGHRSHDTGSCDFCGNSKHSRAVCPARNVVCHKCNKPGHFAKVCRSTPVQNSRSNKSFSNALHYTPTLSSILASSVFYLECLVDTGSSDSFINLSVVNQFKLKSILSESHGGSVNLAAGKQAASVYGSCRVSLDVFSEHH